MFTNVMKMARHQLVGMWHIAPGPSRLVDVKRLVRIEVRLK